MTSILDADTAINRLKEMRGLTYEEAKEIFRAGTVSYSVPVTDENITLNTNINLQTPAGNQTIVVSANAKTGTAVVAGTGLNLYSVTSGKTFYVTSICLYHNAAGGIVLRDGGIAGTLKFSSYAIAAAQAGEKFVCPTPIAFTTNVFFDCAANGDVRYTISGFEQ